MTVRRATDADGAEWATYLDGVRLERVVEANAEIGVVVVLTEPPAPKLCRLYGRVELVHLLTGRVER